MYLVGQFWRLKNGISKLYHEKTQKNDSKYVLFGPVNSCSKSFVNLQGKHPRGSVFLNKVAS